ncbi:hypothetical protein HG535_0C04330 [Zygotorulaspora mrakii]|uniref:NADPH:adrenodoxin oxidoreductase, mitochondrial n=1 Tax=Zygotorulaspora mrakii TaxID=42260 RepID=A0A7H9B267_ZYGMR|nr:uncharacterized protein HG535_0C04330 [Zygotorulaspora mrakii]QLG72079.1 hypothetical protein HG535_0C04330 [Zygotorulaspora mrakii]
MELHSLSKVFVRSVSDNVARRRVSVIGSGPSGFYTAYHLLSKSTVPLHVTIWEKLLVPFGLSRYGVAPDHPEVKNCEDTFSKCANTFSGSDHKHKFEFVGGVEIGKQIKLSELLAQEDAVILSYGCSGDRKLGIDGESTAKGVFSSRTFVNWYNGHPYFAHDPYLTEFDWTKVRNVGIIGNGNVALDLTRLLVSNKIGSIWNPTDISLIALNCLRSAPIKNVKIIARRDFVHSKFTNKELRELWELERYGIRGKIDPEFFNETMCDTSKINDRVFKRRVEMCAEYLKPFDKRTKKNYKKYVPPAIDESEVITWELDYLKSPLKVNVDEHGKIESLNLCKNKTTKDSKLVKTQDEVTYEMDLLITSLGYEGKPLEEFKDLGIKFDGDHMANINGRVQDIHGVIFPKLYASGWIRRGSQGVIASTMQGAFDVADIVMQDISHETKTTETTREIDLSGIKHTTWSDWQKINKSELEAGVRQSKTRVKYLDDAEILQFLASNKS